MVEIIFASVCVGVTLILGMFALSRDFLLWLARRDDKEWAKEFDKYQADFLRMKHTGQDTGWGI